MPAIRIGGASTGQIWRVDTDGTVTLLEADMGTTNGIEVSPDENVLYVNESAQRNVWAYDLSPEGDIGQQTVAHSVSRFQYGRHAVRY